MSDTRSRDTVAVDGEPTQTHGRPAGTRTGGTAEDRGVDSAPMAANPSRGAVPTQVAQPRRAVRRLVRRRATLRRVDPWSVLKLSLIFYLCMLAVGMLVLTMFWAVVNRIGLLDTVLSFLAELRLEVEVNGGNIARAAFLVGLLNVVLWSGINVFLAFLYNLIADLVGGLKVTLAEEE